MKDAVKIKQTVEKLYGRYAKPLEKKYWGKYIAISPKGQTVLASTLNEASKKAVKFGRGNFIFKIGEFGHEKIGKKRELIFCQWKPCRHSVPPTPQDIA